MLCSISSFTKWRPQFIEIQLVLVLEVMALPAHAHMDVRLSIKKREEKCPFLDFMFSIRGFCALILTPFSPRLYFMLTRWYLQWENSQSLALGWRLCLQYGTHHSTMGSASCWCSCIERETFDITDYERDTWRKNSDFTNIECYLNVS